MPYNMSDEAIAIARGAFNSNGSPGTLEQIVRAAHERAPDIRVDVDMLKKQYAGLGCLYVGEFIEYLNTDGKRLLETGSGSIDLAGVTRGEFSPESAMSLQELYIGNQWRNISPLQWLAYLVNGLPGAGVPLEQIQAFDLFCGALLLH